MNLTKSDRGLLDHLLVMVGSFSSVLSIGMSIGRPNLGWTLAIMVAVSGFVGHWLSILTAKTKIANWDAGLWTILGLSAVFFIRPLNNVLPDDGFPFQILAAGVLCWMIILCTLVSWRDRTLLFVSLPSLALFGLVGTFEYTPGIFFFFCFLLCMGVLYARVHQRAMIRRAELAGEGDTTLLARGPWRWMAGPEWAFASGFVIVLLSLIGAPIAREVVKPVAGTVRIQLQQQQRQQPQNPAAQRPTEIATDAQIGRGPTTPSDIPVLQVKMDRPRLLRVQAYGAYTGRGWNNERLFVPEDSPLTGWVDLSADSARGPNGGLQPWPDLFPAGEVIRDPEFVEVSLRALSQLPRQLPSPGPVVEVEPTFSQLRFFPDGGTMGASGMMPGAQARYYAAVPSRLPNDEAQAVVMPELQDYFSSRRGISPRVGALAREVTADRESDWDKARAIQRAVTMRVRYNLNAPSTPPNTDPVEHFLFESQEGYCDLFASSVVLMARSVGMPARYMTGWLINDPRPGEDGYWTLRERNFHAWAEIYFEGYGWVPFDATEGAEEVPGGGLGDRRRPGFFEAIAPYVLPGLAIILILGAALPLAYYGFKQVKALMDPESRRKAGLLNSYNSFALATERLTGTPKKFSQTMREYVDQSRGRLGPLAEEAERLTEFYERAMFSPDQATPDEVKEAAKAVAVYRAQVVKLAKEQKGVRPAPVGA